MDILFDLFILLPVLYIIYKYISINKIKKESSRNSKNASGCEIATKVMEDLGFESIYVVETTNPFFEGYDDSRQVMRISKDRFNSENLFDTITIIKDSIRIKKASESLIGNIYVLVNKLFFVLNIICFISIILTSVLRDINLLKLSLIIFISMILIRIILINYEKTISTLAKDKMLELNYIDEDDDIMELLSCTNFYYVVEPIDILNKIKKYFISK